MVRSLVLVAILDAFLGLGACKRTSRSVATAPGTSAARPDDAVPAIEADRHQVEVRPDWSPGTLGWDTWPIDVSWLNDGDRPAGRHGKVTAQGDHLAFADGKSARFWGTNVVGRALFRGDHAEVARQAKRIAALGYNLVRIHHHDSAWVDPNVFDKGPTTQVLDRSAVDRIDWWVKCLKDEGVYIWLDLHVGRRFRSGDQVAGWTELEREGGDGRGFNYVNPGIERLMQSFAEQYLGHVNPYTGLAAKDDPALAAVLLTNENDLTCHFGGRLVPAAHNPVHQALFEEAAARFARTAGLPLPQSLRLWESGPSKIVSNELEARFFLRSIERLRGIGVTAPIATTSYWGDDALACLPSLAVGDVVDTHAYGEPGALRADPRRQANFISWIGAAQLVGKPLTITEWNVEYPKWDRFTAPLYVASIAALQGWDAPMLYSYWGEALAPPSQIPTWSTGLDPALTALMPAAAIMFRRQDVQEARRTFRFTPSRADVFQRGVGPATSATLRTLVEQSRLVVALPELPELAWDRAPPPLAPGEVVVTDPNQDFIPPGRNDVRSDTGQLDRDWRSGLQTIDTPRSQAAAGAIGQRQIHLHDIDLDISTPAAAVAFTSLDGAPLATSGRVLVTAVAQAASGPGNAPPLRAEPVVGSFVFRSARPSMVMTPLAPDAYPTASGALPTSPGNRNSDHPLSAGPAVVPAALSDGYRFTLPRGVATHWFVIEPAMARAHATPR